MHLTNYSINKHNENFDRDDSDDSGSERYNITTLLYSNRILCILITAICLLLIPQKCTNCPFSIDLQAASLSFLSV